MCCVDGLRRNQESSSRPSCPRVGPDRRSPFGPAPTSPSSQYALRRGRSGGSDRASVWPASSRSTSRRNSSMRARMVAKSSAARGRFTSAPPIALVKIWSDRRGDRGLRLRTFLLPFLLNLAGRDPHDLDGVADHVGGTLLALGSAGHVLSPWQFIADCERSALPVRR